MKKTIQKINKIKIEHMKKKHISVYMNLYIYIFIHIRNLYIHSKSHFKKNIDPFFANTCGKKI